MPRVSCGSCGRPSNKPTCDQCRMPDQHQHPLFRQNKRIMMQLAVPIYQRGSWIDCCICSLAVVSYKDLSIEHHVQVKDGGSHDRSNLGYAHRRCNYGSTRTQPRLRYQPPA